MKLRHVLTIHGGGSGSGCQGPNCGRPSAGGGDKATAATDQMHSLLTDAHFKPVGRLSSTSSNDPIYRANFGGETHQIICFSTGDWQHVMLPPDKMEVDVVGFGKGPQSLHDHLKSYGLIGGPYHPHTVTIVDRQEPRNEY